MLSPKWRKADKQKPKRAIAAAAKAFRTGGPNRERALDHLYRWYELIIENKKLVWSVNDHEQGKPLKEAEGEVSTPPVLFSGLPKRPSALTVKYSADQTGRSPHSGYP